MPGIRALAKTQFGLESMGSSAGTAVAASRVWRGPVAMPEDAREFSFVEENVGILGGTNRSNVAKLQANITLPETVATFEQIPLVLMCALESVTAGTSDGVGSDYIYQYDYPTTAVQTIRTMTIEGGDNQRVDEVEYAFVDEFTIKGAAGEPVTIESSWIGRQLTDCEFTTTTGGLAALTSVEEINFGKSYLYIDTSGTTVGTTVKSNTLLGFSFASKSGWIPVFTPAGTGLYFDFPKYVANEEAKLEVTFEHDGTAEAEITAYRAETPRKIRVKCQGATLGTAGTLYSKKELDIDIAGKWESFAKIDEQDGNDIVTGVLAMRYDEDAAFRGRITVVNELSTMIS
jgi:hypothetical protein